ncbi:MAG: CBS domain-containing protein [Acidimicrobiia bacterium]
MPRRLFSTDAPTLWTRGEGCAELADVLSPVGAVRVEGDLPDACVKTRAEAVVSRRLSSSFELVAQVIPDGVDLSKSGSIVAAVSGGPHSPLAAEVAARIGQVTGLSASMVCAYRDEEGQSSAVRLIQDLYSRVPDIEYRLVEAEDAASLTAQLPEDATLVLGAPGGGWLQRTFFGQGVKLIQAAPAGAIVVRSAPRRVFQHMGEPVYVSPLLDAVDLLRIHREHRLAVADAGRLVGLVRRDALDLAEPGVPVSDLMEDPRSVNVTDAVDDIGDLWREFSPDPIPVVDDDGSLVGGLVLD